ncbi:MAG: rod shape-determining protein MreC [Gallionella sp.]|jgi:rod shape-determining protein MreC|nr:rod shape-determining protein MreC [Gallionella sp.]
MDSTQQVPFFNRGPGPVVRLVFFAVLSLLLLFADARYHYLESARSVLSVVLSPLQRTAAFPGSLWRQAGDFFVTQDSLVDENLRLHRQHEQDAAQLLQLQALQEENRQLRNLMELPARAALKTYPVEIIYTERDAFKRKVIVSRGEDAQLKAGQIVMDDGGIVGQLTRIYPWMSEVTLITERNFPVPVQVLRTGLRTIAFGAGDTSRLSLRYLPVSADVQSGDLLVTSGIDRIYPAGIPVAKVVKVERDASYPFARVSCMPVGGVDSHRHLLVVSGPGAVAVSPEAMAGAK